MSIILFLLRSSWVTVAFAVLAGGVSGAGGALMIASVNTAISNPSQQAGSLPWVFLGLAITT
ncbi:MAG: hypothetical protein AAGF98_13385, partial [Cyanobacteria bacterium P01_H01_bin.153]